MKNHPLGLMRLALIASVSFTTLTFATQPVSLKSIGDKFVGTNQPLSIDLGQYFRTDAVTNLVRVTTTLKGVNGSPQGFTLQLFPTNAPQTVANFLAYVNDGAYENMLIHRSVPGFVFQTGGYDYSGGPIATWTNVVPSEYGLSNVRGTVAMALVGTNANSATDQWFVNLVDNSAVLDDTNTAGNPPFTVFARVVGTGTQTVDAIAALPVYKGYSSPFNELPVFSTNTTNITTLTNLVHISRVATIPYFALSEDGTTYSAKISNSTLTVEYQGGTNLPQSPLTISVIATDSNGLSTNNSFQVWYQTNVPRTISYPYTNISYSTNPFYLQALPKSSDGTGVTNLTIASAGPLYSTTNGFYIHGTGTITIRAIQSPSLFFQGVTNLISIVVGKASNSITFPPLTTNASNTVVFSTNPFIFTKATSSSGLPVSLAMTSNSPSIWNVSNSQILFKGTGTVTLVANQAGNSNYLAADPVTNTLIVAKASQSITFPQPTNQILTDKNPTPLVSLQAVSTSKLPVQYRIVSGRGSLTNSSVKVSGTGTIQVEASLAESENYLAAAPVTNSFTAKYAQTLSAFAKIPAKTYTNPYATFSVALPTSSSVLPSSTNVVLTATPTNLATISGNNSVTITGAGTVTLTASQAGDDYYFPTNVSTSFVVAKAPQTIAPIPVIANKSNGIAPFPIVVPNATSGLPVTITSSGVGSVSTNGTNVVVTLTTAGKVTLTATQSGNSNYLAAKAVTTTFAVSKGNQTITFPEIATDHSFGETFSLNATASPSGLPVSYKILTGTNAARIIPPDSIYITRGSGTVTVIASQAGNAGYNAATPRTNSFTILLQTNSGSQGTGGTLNLGGSNYTPYYPPVTTN